MEESLRFTGKLGIESDVVTNVRCTTQVVIKAKDEVVRTFSGQVMLEVATNLMSRLFPNIKFEVSNYPAHFLQSDLPLPEYLERISKDSYQWPDMCLTDEKTIYLVIGCSDETFENAVYIDANGWLAFIGVRSSTFHNLLEKNNPIGAVASACLGVSEVFKRVFKPYIPKQMFLVENDIYFNTLTYTSDTQVNPSIQLLDIHDVALFGCGSVGSSLLYTLSFFPNIQGYLDIIDRDKEIDQKNLQRYSFLTQSDLSQYSGVSKANWAKSKLKARQPNLSITAFSESSIMQYINQRTLKPGLQVAISAVDNIKARLEITDCLGNRTINAGTGDTTLTITKHGFGDGKACLACQFISNTPNVSWFQEVSNHVGIPLEKAAALLEGGKLLEESELQMMSRKGFITETEVENLVQTDLNSLVNRRLYAAIPMRGNGVEEKPVTAPFVSTLAGCLLTGELIKELNGFGDSWTNNRYRTDLLSHPSDYTTLIPNGDRRCLCQNNFRRQKYKQMWS